MLLVLDIGLLNRHPHPSIGKTIKSNYIPARQYWAKNHCWLGCYRGFFNSKELPACCLVLPVPPCVYFHLPDLSTRL